MDKDKLAELRKKKAEAKAKAHYELLEAQHKTQSAIESLGKSISDSAFDWDLFKQHLEALKSSITFQKEVEKLESIFNKIHKDALTADSLETVINSVTEKNNQFVLSAVEALQAKLEENTASQSPEDFQPVRRVVKVGNRLIFDDLPTQFNSGGGGSSSGGIQTTLTRNGVTSIAVVNPDGTTIAGGSGGGGDASAANQVTQTGVLEEIRDNQLPDGHDVTVDNQITGFATETKQDDIISLLDDGSTFTKKTTTVSSSGDNTIHTPAEGKKIRLYFFGYSAGSNVEGVLASLKFATNGIVFDRQYLISPGQPYARNIQAGKRYIDGAIDEPLVLNLDAAQTVYCNVELEEI